VIGAILRTTLLTFIPGLMLDPLGQGLTDRLP
jgi:hypothetical protein